MVAITGICNNCSSSFPFFLFVFFAKHLFFIELLHHRQYTSTVPCLVEYERFPKRSSHHYKEQPILRYGRDLIVKRVNCQES